MKYFNYETGFTMITDEFTKLFGNPVRESNQLLTRFHMDVASSIQAVTEEIILSICKSVRNEFKIDNLCLAGGVALNCVANGKIFKKENI